MKRSWLLAGLGAIALAIQLVPVTRDNPPVTGALVPPADLAPVLERACADCHSNQTRWPWYAWVAPVSWLVAHDVEEGRGELNFSTWESYSAKKQAKLAREMVELVEKREMPLWIYLGMHPRARVTPGELERLRVWSATLQPASAPAAP